MTSLTPAGVVGVVGVFKNAGVGGVVTSGMNRILVTDDILCTRLQDYASWYRAFFSLAFLIF